MKRMIKIIVLSSAVGLAIPFIWGFLLWNAEKTHRVSLDQALWVIDANGFKHSPTSQVVRMMLANLEDAGVDIYEKKWDAEFYINFSNNPDIIRKALFEQIQQRE